MFQLTTFRGLEAGQGSGGGIPTNRPASKQESSFFDRLHRGAVFCYEAAFALVYAIEEESGNDKGVLAVFGHESGAGGSAVDDSLYVCHRAGVSRRADRLPGIFCQENPAFDFWSETIEVPSEAEKDKISSWSYCMAITKDPNANLDLSRAAFSGLDSQSMNQPTIMADEIATISDKNTRDVFQAFYNIVRDNVDDIDIVEQGGEKILDALVVEAMKYYVGRDPVELLGSRRPSSSLSRDASSSSSSIFFRPLYDPRFDHRGKNFPFTVTGIVDEKSRTVLLLCTPGVPCYKLPDEIVVPSQSGFDPDFVAKVQAREESLPSPPGVISCIPVGPCEAFQHPKFLTTLDESVTILGLYLSDIYDFERENLRGTRLWKSGRQFDYDFQALNGLNYIEAEVDPTNPYWDEEVDPENNCDVQQL